MEEIIKFIFEEIGWKLIWKPAAHFALSGGVGLLVYWLTSTTLSHYYSGQKTLKLLTGVSGMHRFSFLLAVAFAIWFHILEDYTLNWF